jgi:hypothetical protein
VEKQPRERQVWREGACGGKYETITDTISVNVPYTKYVPFTRIVKKWKTKMVPRTTKNPDILIGYDVKVFKVTRKGTEKRGWEVNADWSDLKWDQSQTTKELSSSWDEPIHS